MPELPDNEGDTFYDASEELLRSYKENKISSVDSWGNML